MTRKMTGPAGRVQAPFTEQQVESWNQALTTLADVQRQIELAMQAGINCAEDDQACKALQSQLDLLKRTYAPGVP